MKPNWFIAWPATLPASWMSALRPPARFRVFHPDDLHATIAFLGGVSEASARRAWAALPDALGGPYEAQWGPVCPMGRPERYSALAAELHADSGALRREMAVLQPLLLTAAGARPARHPPRPHVTLVRPQRRASERAREAGLAWASTLALPAPTVRLERVALYTWSADRRHRLFRIVEERRLTG